VTGGSGDDYENSHGRKVLARVFCALALLLATSSPAFAEPIKVISYSIEDAVTSGFGGWAHIHSGTITPVRDFTNGTGGPAGVVANYDDGSGTLNDDLQSRHLLSVQHYGTDGRRID
jgi:hypothetical protein